MKRGEASILMILLALGVGGGILFGVNSLIQGSKAKTTYGGSCALGSVIQDTCSDGSQIISASCLNGVMTPTGASCTGLIQSGVPSTQAYAPPLPTTTSMSSATPTPVYIAPATVPTAEQLALGRTKTNPYYDSTSKIYYWTENGVVHSSYIDPRQTSTSTTSSLSPQQACTSQSGIWSVSENKCVSLGAYCTAPFGGAGYYQADGNCYASSLSTVTSSGQVTLAYGSPCTPFVDVCTSGTSCKTGDWFSGDVFPKCRA